MNIHSSITHNSQMWQQLICPSTDERMRYTHTVKYYMKTQRNEGLINGMIWKTPGNTELRQAGKMTE